MAIGAMCDVEPVVAALRHLVVHVLLVGAHAEVRDVHAGRRVARVEYVHPFRNWPAQVGPNPSVRDPLLTVGDTREAPRPSELAVTLPTLGPSPKDASVLSGGHSAGKINRGVHV